MYKCPGLVYTRDVALCAFAQGFSHLAQNCYRRVTTNEMEKKTMDPERGVAEQKGNALLIMDQSAHPISLGAGGFKWSSSN